MHLEFCRKSVALAVLVFILAASFMPVLAFEGSAKELSDRARSIGSQWNSSAAKEAVELYFAASDEFVRIDDLSSAAQSLRRAARMQEVLGQLDKAVLTAKRSVGFNDRLSASDAIKNLSLYARLLAASGNHAAASASLTRISSLIERTGDPVSRGFYLRALGEIQEQKGDFAKAESNLEQAAALLRNGEDENLLANTLVALGGVRIATGRYLQGLANADEAKTLYSNSGDRRLLNKAVILRGHFLNMLGRKQEALEEYLAAEKAFPQDIDLIERGRLLSGLGFLYHELGEYELALARRRAALEIFEKENYVLGVELGLSILVEANFKIKNDEAAFDYLRRSEDFARRNQRFFGLAAARKFVGDHYFQAEEYDLAVPFYTKALNFFDRASSLFSAASTNDMLGCVYAHKGDKRLARKYFDRSLELNERIHNRLGVNNTLYNLARLKFSEGDLAEALKFSQASVDGTERISATVSNSKLRSSHFASVSDRFDFHVQLLMEVAEKTGDPSYAEQALQAAERARARTLLEKISMLGSGGTVRADAPPETLKAEQDLLVSYNAASDRLANLVDLGDSQEAIDLADREIREIEQKLAQLHTETKAKSPFYSAIRDPASFHLTDLDQTVFEKDTLVLEYWLGQKESYLWVIGENAAVSSYRLPGREEIQGRVSALRQLISANEKRPDETVEQYQERLASAERDYPKQARDLSNILLAPAAEKLAGKRIVIIADGGLHALPFSALPLPGSTDDQPVLATNQIIYEPSLQTLALLAAKHTADTDSRRNLLVFSDPVFSAEDERLTRAEIAAAPDTRSLDNFRFIESLSSLTRLRGSGREAATILETIGSSSDQVTGFAATREAFLNADLAGYKILHIATHAKADTERPDQSGIVFSRFAEDGGRLNEMIRLPDIYSLKLNCDLVVLSACETGIGKELKGEGVLSLNNAFIQSGSKAVLSTLWKVEDEASQILMKKFYEGIANQHLTPSESLMRAQIHLMEHPRFNSPFYWAAFTIHGDIDVRPRIEATHSFFALAASAAAVAFSAFGIGLVLYRRRRKRSPAAAA